MTKSFYKKLWFWLTIIAILLCVGNILLAHFYRDTAANIFTAISGWVSGIATIALGVIAVIQNKKYKKENENFELFQTQREWRIEQKEIIKSYLNNIESIYKEIQEYQFSKIIDDCISKLKSTPNTVVDIAYIHTLKCLFDKLVSVVINNNYYFDGTEELLLQCQKYISYLMEQLDKLENSIENGDSDFFDELYLLYKDLIDLFNVFIANLHIFIRHTMTNDDPMDIEKKLGELFEKQKVWREKMKQQLTQDTK